MSLVCYVFCLVREDVSKFWSLGCLGFFYFIGAQKRLVLLLIVI